MLFHLFKEAQKINEFKDLNDEFNILISRVKNNGTITEEDDNEFYEITKTQWKRNIAYKCNELEHTIRKRITKGQNFSNNFEKIDKIRRGSERELEFEQYSEYFKDLMGIEKDVEAKITIERYQIGLFVAGLLIGALLGYLIRKYFG